MKDHETDIYEIVEQDNSPDRRARPQWPASLTKPIEELERARQRLEPSVRHKLDFLLDQMRFLRKEAWKVVNQAIDSDDLHKIQCGFQKEPGMVVHVYSREEGSRFLSLVAPDEFKRHDLKHHGSFLINSDMSFSCMEEHSDL